MTTDLDSLLDPAEPPTCVPPPYSMINPQLPLPADMLMRAANDAVRLNSANAPMPGTVSALETSHASSMEDLVDLLTDLLGRLGHLPHTLPPKPAPMPIAQRIAIMTSMYWGPEPRTLTVSFMDGPQEALKAKILGHMNAWNCGIRFEPTNGVGMVRIARMPNSGYWSYLGVSILQIPENEPTMNLERFTLDTPDSEFFRVVRHETGHTLGCPHEHTRRAIVELLDRNAVYRYFGRTQGWSRADIDHQILIPIDEVSLMGTPADVDSIMTYMFAAGLTLNRKGIPGGTDITDRDRAFVLTKYPVAITTTPTPTPVPTPTPTGTPGTVEIPLSPLQILGPGQSINGQSGILTISGTLKGIWTPAASH